MRLINVMASSLDGRIGAHDHEGDEERQSIGLSSGEDQKRLRSHIEKAEAIIVGATSIRANGSCLDHPGSSGKAPAWYIFAKHPIPEHYDFWKQQHIPRILVSPEPLPVIPGSGVVNLVYGEENPADFVYERLSAAGVQTALLFGGGVINSWFYERSLVDQLELTLSPLVLGKPNAPFLISPKLSRGVQFLLLSTHVSESFVFLSYSVVSRG